MCALTAACNHLLPCYRWNSQKEPSKKSLGRCERRDAAIIGKDMRQRVSLRLAPGLTGLMPLTEADVTDATDINLWRAGDKVDVEVYDVSILSPSPVTCTSERPSIHCTSASQTKRAMSCARCVCCTQFCSRELHGRACSMQRSIPRHAISCSRSHGLLLCCHSSAVQTALQRVREDGAVMVRQGGSAAPAGHAQCLA